MATSRTDMMPKPAFAGGACALRFSPCSCSSSTRFFASAFSLSTCNQQASRVVAQRGLCLPKRNSKTWAISTPIHHTRQHTEFTEAAHIWLSARR